MKLVTVPLLYNILHRELCLQQLSVYCVMFSQQSIEAALQFYLRNYGSRTILQQKRYAFPGSLKSLKPTMVFLVFITPAKPIRKANPNC